MYLKFIRQNQPCGNMRRGKLYSVHFQPNEKGGFNEHLTYISDAYEIVSEEHLPLPLIYDAGVRRTNGHWRLALGRGDRRSLLHLIDIQACEEFIQEVRAQRLARTEIRIEICSDTIRTQ